ncbi:MAG: hypothetical protein U0T36_05325 [Saprospiraceae bacterium]
MGLTGTTVVTHSEYGGNSVVVRWKHLGRIMGVSREDVRSINGGR